MSILEKINSSEDIKKLNDDELQPLCGEIREFLVNSLSKTGGHLASNLGTVELTVAIHRVYDTSRDRLIFDVGHQSYTHKIITGRRDKFSTLRQHGGLSGFPKPYESNDDAFIAGHASNSISVALGMAKARTMAGDDYNVVAVIGDGALTGGLSYEGLAGAAASGEPMVIILNDNNMSIDPNVGGTAKLLQKMRIKPGYLHFKRWFRVASRKVPGLYGFSHNLKETVKAKVLHGNMFSAMGLNYFGPVDGHNIPELETVLQLAKDANCPVIVHVLTQKGRGYSYAEEHPELYHGVGPYDPKSGKLTDSGINFSSVFGESLCEFAQRDKRICAITAAMASGTGIDGFAKKFPDRFIDVGIAEGHAVSMCGGLAKQGALPVFAVYSSFMQRGYDMLIHDISLLGMHAVFCLDRAGIVGSDGETHHGVFDVDFLSTIPGMTVMCPANFAEMHDMLEKALFEFKGPVALRYPRGGEGQYRLSHTEPETILREGSDITIVCYGTMTNEVLKAAEILSEKGISAEIVKLGIIKPCKFDKVIDSVRKTGRFIISEDVCASGCVGSRILSAVACNGESLKGIKLLNLGEGIVSHGKPSELLRDFGLDAEGIVTAAEELMSR